MSKPATKKRAPRGKPRLRTGTHVVPNRPNALEGADPFTELVVTTVHKDGTVDVDAVTGTTWVRVPADDLDPI